MTIRRKNDERSTHWFRQWKGWTAAMAVLVVGASIYLWWASRPPVVSLQNLKYIQLLRTAVSSQSVDMVQRVERAIEELSAKHQLSDSEQRHFRNIIRIARQGQWQKADRMAFAFEEAQLNRRR